MTRTLTAHSSVDSDDFVQYEIVEGYSILLDKRDLRRVSARHWYLSVEKKCNSTHFITSMKIGFRCYQKLTLQSFLTGVIPGMIAKIIDKDSPSNYRRSNLMIVSAREQSQAFGKRKGLYSSIYKGVSFRKERDKWAAMIKCPNGKHKLVGYFDDENEAALAYNRAARELFGNHAFQNEVQQKIDELKNRKALSRTRFHKPRTTQRQR